MAQKITLELFKVQTLIGRTYGNPPPVLEPFRGTYQGECVSYVRQYLEAVLGITSQRVGHAADFYNSPFMAQYFDKVTDGSRKDGDILCWGDDEGNWTGKEGHIAISYGGRILNQNFGGSRRVSIDNFFPNGYQGALRLKGAKPSMNQPAIEQLVTQSYRAATDIDPTNEQAAYWVGRIREDNNRASELLSALGGATYQGDPAFRTKARNYDKDVAAANGGFTETKVYVKNETKGA